MKARRRIAGLWLAISIAAAAASGQTVVQPGSQSVAQPQLLSVNRTLPASASSSSFLPTASVPVDTSSEGRTAKRVWIASIAAMLAGTSMDAATSWGRHEGNGLLAQSNGSFGPRGVGIKVGVAAASLVPQIVFRKHKELRLPFTVGNFAEAGIFAGTAIHNLNVK